MAATQCAIKNIVNCRIPAAVRWQALICRWDFLYSAGHIGINPWVFAKPWHLALCSCKHGTWLIARRNKETEQVTIWLYCQHPCKSMLYPEKLTLRLISGYCLLVAAARCFHAVFHAVFA